MIWDVGDANPLHRRIPGEVVSRRKPQVVKKPPPEQEPAEVAVDLKVAVSLKPEQRLKWLTKACDMVADSKVSSTDVYDIIVNRKFVAGMPERVVRKISVLIEEKLDLFSDKQQRYLRSTDCPIMARLVVREQVFEGPAEDGYEDIMKSKLVAAADDVVDTVQRKAEPYSTPQSILPPRTAVSKVGQTEQKTQMEAVGGSSSQGTWQSVKDEWTIRRQEAEAKEQWKREVAKREEKKRSLLAEEEEARLIAEKAEEERRRKLEEEADALFSQAVAPASSAQSDIMSKQKKGRSLSRSRSISSHTARRLARAAKAEQAEKRGRHWRKDEKRHGELSGSRAIFMNRDFVEDLPHMPRPVVPGTQGCGGRDRANPSPSRERAKRRRQ